MSKDFLCFYFVVDQVLSISGNDLENGGMSCKQKYKTENMDQNFWFWFCFAFAYSADFLQSLL